MLSAHFNPRLPRGRRLNGHVIASLFIKISIHASLAGGDDKFVVDQHFHVDFNPRLPRGRRRIVVWHVISFLTFQSTPPSREATLRRTQAQADIIDFNPRLPRGRRLSVLLLRSRCWRFQSTPPSREATAFFLIRRVLRRYFNPRLPRGRRL